MMITYECPLNTTKKHTFTVSYLKCKHLQFFHKIKYLCEVL